MKEKKRILVTSALPYANGPLHLGHIAGAYLPADIYVRYQRLRGSDIIYICGSDEHGVPITVTADKENITPQEVVDRYHEMNRSDFEKLGISFDHYSRTSTALHHKTAASFFTELNRKGDLVIKEEEQFYSKKSRRFLPDRYVEGQCPHCGYNRARGDQCDKCGKWFEPGELLNPKSNMDGSIPVLKKTSHWYLPMGRFADAWKQWFISKKWKENVQNYSMGWYEEGLGDRPITRDLHWGVPVPLKEAEGKVLYVWFDAPIGYISATKEWAVKIGDPDLWEAYWKDSDTKLVHFIGKDNIVFHAILFPMILMEMGGYVLPDAIPANEYLTIEGRKISTSLNYAIWLKDYLEIFPPDPLRYTLAANAPETKDTDFSWGQFQSRNNDELADILGNFINRTLTFIHRNFKNRVPARGELDKSDKEMVALIEEAPRVVGELYEKFQVRNAARSFMDVCRSANKYFNDQAPWETLKKQPAKCATTLNICCQMMRVINIIMTPILPFSSIVLRKMLGLGEELSWNESAFAPMDEGHMLGQPEILFSKIEDSLILRQKEKLNEIVTRGTGEKDKVSARISFDTFKRVELKTAKVTSAEKVKGTEKLLKLMVDLGEQKRQIVAGVAESYQPGDILGKTVIIVSNLEPTKIKGIVSEGMLLAVKTEKGYSILTAEGTPVPGTPVE